MAWTVTLEKQEVANGKVVLLVFTNGIRTVRNAYDAQAGLDVDRIAKETIARLDAQDAVFDAIEVGELIPKEPPPPPGPTDEEKAQAQFKQDVLRLVRSKSTIDHLAQLGLSVDEPAEISGLRKTVQDALTAHPEYINLISI